MISASVWYNHLVRIVYVLVVVGCVALLLYTPGLIEKFLHKKSITILVWPTAIDTEFLADFEQSTGIKVHVSYVETNEEIMAKIRAQQISAYDLIMASDYMIDQMVQCRLLQPLKRDFFVHWHKLYKGLANLYFDPDNRYSIPFFWDMYGLCVDGNSTDIQQAAHVGWGLIFDSSKISGPIGMIEDYREAVILAATYLWCSTNTVQTLQDLSIIKDLLSNQKAWVTRYTDSRGGALVASQAARAAVTISTDVIRLKQYHPSVEFVVPDNGKFMIVDSFAIPNSTKKQDWVYQFLNYLYDPDILQRYANKHTLRTSHMQVKAAIITDTIEPDQQFMSSFSFFKTGISDKQLSKLWISVLS